MTGQNNEKNLILGEDYYLSELGYKVFTEKFHFLTMIKVNFYFIIMFISTNEITLN